MSNCHVDEILRSRRVCRRVGQRRGMLKETLESCSSKPMPPHEGAKDKLSFGPLPSEEHQQL